MSATKHRGFTIIELMVAVVTLVILAVAAFVAINPAKRIGDSQDGRRKVDLQALQAAIQLYAADYGAMPSEFSLSGLGSSDRAVICGTAGTPSCLGQSINCVIPSSLMPTYIPTIPRDPIEGHDVDTGYYITRRNNNSLTFGSCHATAGATMEIASNLALPAYVAPPPACSGYDANGYCWYLAANNTQDCTTVCASHGGCNASGTWNDTAACVVGKHFAPACSCYASQAFGGEHTVSPKIYSTTSCYYRASGSSYCNNPSSLPSGHKRLCACNS